MPRFRRRALLLACAGFLSLALLGAFFRGRDDEGLRVNRPRPAGEAFEDELVDIGGVKRRRGEIRPRTNEASRERPERRPFDYGDAPPVPLDANPQVASVAEALQTGQHPERLSVLISPPPFDAAAYGRNPQAYLDIVEPGRVFQTAQPGPDVPRLKPLTSRLSTIEQGQSVRLRAQAVAGAPVTFTSFDLGAFENQLTSITVRADAEGIATATFTGTTGAIYDVNILAGGPMTAGQLRYIVHILPPKQSGLDQR